MLHSHSPQMVSFPQLRSHSSDIGLFVCIMSACGSNMVVTEMFHSLPLRAFLNKKQYFNVMEGQRKPFNDYIIHDLDKSSLQ